MTEAVSTTTTWTIDPIHSVLEFAVKHMMFTTAKGRFSDFSGTITFDPENVESSSIEVTIETDSITTTVDPRDAHLRSADFFDCETYPEATFRSTRIEPKGEHEFTVYGDFTIKGVTKEVVLDAAFLGSGTIPGGAAVAGFAATTAFDRRDFGLTWNHPLESGGVLVSDEVKLSLDVQAGKAGDQA